MIIVDFTAEHSKAAQRLIGLNYQEEREAVPALPVIETMPDVADFTDKGMGVAAFENGEMLGYLSAYPPIPNAFGTMGISGIWSPLHAHAAVRENRAAIYQRLYQAAAKKWVAQGVISHAITLYTHDDAAVGSFFKYGFGLRCIDAVRALDAQPPLAPSAYRFSELKISEGARITHLRNLLIEHLGLSPCFLHYKKVDEQGAADIAIDRNSRMFIAEDGGAIIGFIEVMEDGENFACDAPDMPNICGACFLPQYRGKGVARDLLNHVMNTLHHDGYKRLGVDFESFNPTASGFWLKYFEQYTSSVVRRIDETGNSLI